MSTYNDIPLAPEYTHPISSSSSSRNMRTVRCDVLSKQKCDDASSCSWSDAKKVCEPIDQFNLTNNRISNTYDEYFLKKKRMWRIGTSAWLSDFQGCLSLEDILSHAKIYSSTEKDSVSPSIIMAGTLFPSSADKDGGDNNVIIKASYKNRDLRDNSLDVEIAIYKNIMTNLVNNHHTPCVMSYLGSGICTNISEFKLPKSISAKFDEETENIREYSGEDFDFDHLNLLYLEKSGGIQLLNWIDASRSEKDVLSVIFQVVYTLMCFSNIRLRHNDLHFGNIFIEELPAPITMYFARGGNRYVELKTKWIAKIYDFDRGSCLHPAVPRNLLLDFNMCDNYGTCNAPNNKFDLFTFIYMLHYGYGEKLNPDIKLSIKTQWITKTLRWMWYYEIIQDANDFKQYIRHTPKESDMKSPRESLSIFIDAAWSDSPFTTINLSPAEVSHIPIDMLFTPPVDRSEQEPVLWQPITTESHQALIYGSINENDFYWGDEASVRLKPVKDIWDREVTAIHGYIAQDKILFNKIKEAKLIPESLTKLYTMAAFLLQLPIWYELDVESQQAVANPMVRKAISDVWNIFSNKLPIQITRRT